MTSKAILSLQKQNDSIYGSLIAKNIKFDRIELVYDADANSNEDEILRLLNEENIKLKELVKANRPIKEEKKSTESDSNLKLNSQTDKKVKSNKKEDDEDFDDDKHDDEPTKLFTTIMNMEDMKRAFFNGEYELFESLLKSNPLRISKSNYKYNNDKDGSQEFSAKNLVKGFVRNLNEIKNCKKHFMICFRCWKHTTSLKYKYESMWIINTQDNPEDIVGDIYSDFDFIELDKDTYVDEFFNQLKKKFQGGDEIIYDEDYVLIDEMYFH